MIQRCLFFALNFLVFELFSSELCVPDDKSVVMLYAPKSGGVISACFDQGVVVNTPHRANMCLREALLEQMLAAYTFLPDIDCDLGSQELMREGVLEHVTKTSGFFSVELESCLKQLEPFLGRHRDLRAITMADIEESIYSKRKTREWSVVSMRWQMPIKSDQVLLIFPGMSYALKGTSCRRKCIQVLDKHNALWVKRRYESVSEVHDAPLKNDSGGAQARSVGHVWCVNSAVRGLAYIPAALSDATYHSVVGFVCFSLGGESAKRLFDLSTVRHLSRFSHCGISSTKMLSTRAFFNEECLRGRVLRYPVDGVIDVDLFAQESVCSAVCTHQSFWSRNLCAFVQQCATYVMEPTLCVDEEGWTDLKRDHCANLLDPGTTFRWQMLGRSMLLQWCTEKKVLPRGSVFILPPGCSMGFYGRPCAKPENEDVLLMHSLMYYKWKGLMDPSKAVA